MQHLEFGRRGGIYIELSKDFLYITGTQKNLYIIFSNSPLWRYGRVFCSTLFCVILLRLVKHVVDMYLEFETLTVKSGLSKGPHWFFQ
jgi:hypothetical protein